MAVYSQQLRLPPLHICRTCTEIPSWITVSVVVHALVPGTAVCGAGAPQGEEKKQRLLSLSAEVQWDIQNYSCIQSSAVLKLYKVSGVYTGGFCVGDLRLTCWWDATKKTATLGIRSKAPGFVCWETPHKTYFFGGISHLISSCVVRHSWSILNGNNISKLLLFLLLRQGSPFLWQCHSLQRPPSLCGTPKFVFFRNNGGGITNQKDVKTPCSFHSKTGYTCTSCSGQRRTKQCPNQRPKVWGLFPGMTNTTNVCTSLVWYSPALVWAGEKLYGNS